MVADAGKWSGPTKSYSFRWLRCDSEGAACAPIGVSQVRYVVIAADVGSTLRVTVIATNKRGSTAATSAPTPVVASRASASGSSSSSTTTAASPIAPTNTSLPTISGATQLGQPLAASSGTWSGTQPIALAYQWFRCGSSGGSCGAIIGATTLSYTLVQADVGTTIRVAVTASNAAGQATATSNPTVAVAPLPPTTAAPTAAPYFTGDFDSCNLLQWRDFHDAWLNATPVGFIVRATPSYSGCASQVNATNQASTSTTGDASMLWEGDGSNSYRLPWLQNGADTWFRMQVAFPNGADPRFPGKFTPSPLSGGWDIFQSWHAAPGAGYSTVVGVSPSSPPTLLLRPVGGAAPPNQTFGSVHQQDATGKDVPLKWNHWYDILVRIKFAPTATDGYIEWWVDGVLQYAAHVPTLTYTSTGSVPGAGHEVGLYRGPSRTDTDTIYIDGVVVGPTRASVGG